VGEIEPGGAGVVEIGEGALLQFFVAQPRRIQPRVALGDHLLRGLGNRLHAWIVRRFLAGRPGEGFEIDLLGGYL